MKTFAVIGTPLAHTLSPVLHNEVFHRLGLDARYIARETAAPELPEIARQLRAGALAGINITAPHKTAFLPHLDDLAPEAGAADAVNCVAVNGGRLVGHNTDLTGIAASLADGAFDAPGSAALVLGAGGAARAAVAALLRLGTSSIHVAARREQAARQLCGALQPLAGSAPLTGRLLDPRLDTGAFRLIMNATPVGMWPRVDSSPLLAEQLHEGQLLFDLVYRPEITLLLERARAAGCTVISGLELFLTQGLASLELWLPGRIYEAPGRLVPELQLPGLRDVLRAALLGQATALDEAPATGERA